METATTPVRNSASQIPQETMVTLQFPEFLKSIYRVYTTSVVFLAVIIFFFVGESPALDGLFGVFFFTAFLSLITGLISIIKCILNRKVMTTGQKIVGWTVSIVTVTIVIPLLVLWAVILIPAYLFSKITGQ